jgi:nicotinamide mononucleotide adenylyltransferase
MSYMNVVVPLIHATSIKVVLYITGGGTEVLPNLLKRGGGSATLLSARIPYANAETAELLGGEPDKYVSEQTTRQLAMAAYQRAVALSTDDAPVIGVAGSSALQKTPNERPGRIHHIYTALQTGTKTISLSTTIDPNKDGFYGWNATRIREWEESVNADLMMNLIAEGCGVEDRLFTGHVKVGHVKVVRKQSSLYCGYFPELLGGAIGALAYTPNMGVFLPLGRGDMPRYLLPGSFNPAHEGHAEMAAYVEKHGVGVCDYELSIRNADKPVLDFITIEDRLKTVKTVGDHRVWLTNAPTFAEKAKIFQNATFLVGYDTMIRIVNPTYGNVDEVYSTFKDCGTRFVVFGREVNGVYHAGLDGIPERFAALCTEVIEPLHYRHVSSSGIRSQSGK